MAGRRADVQLFVVEVDDPQQYRSRTAAVVRDGCTMTAVELDGAALLDFAAGLFREGNIVRIACLRSKTQHTLGLPIITLITDTRAPARLAGNPVRTMEPRVDYPLQVLRAIRA